MTESNLLSELNSLSPQELEVIQKKYPIMLRTNPLEALRLFKEQLKPIVPTPTTQSPFTQLAREGKLPAKVTGGVTKK